MPLGRHEITIGTVTIEVLPFEWPDTPWKMLELELSEATGWRDMTGATFDALKTYYNEAEGTVVDGVAGILVQFVTGYASQEVTITDWRGNTGTFVFKPNDGLDIKEIHGSAYGLDDDDAYFIGRLRFVKV